MGWASVRTRAPGRAVQVGIALQQRSLFWKFWAITNSCQHRFREAQLRKLNLRATHNFWCTNSHLTAPKIHHVLWYITKKWANAKPWRTWNFLLMFFQQPRFGRTSVDIFSWIWRKLIDAAGKSIEILTIMWNFSLNMIFTFSPRLSPTQCKDLLYKTKLRIQTSLQAKYCFARRSFAFKRLHKTSDQCKPRRT